MGRDMEQLYQLNTGQLMPKVALGVAVVKESQEETKAYVLKALEIGYRALDTAQLYNTQVPVGEALQDAISARIVNREEVFIATKIWCDDLTPEDIVPAMKRCLSELKLDYADMILMHWPYRLAKGANPFALKEEDILPFDIVGCWKAFEQGLELGLTKGIGVSNFSTMRLEEILPDAKIVPAVNQMEMHPGLELTKVRRFCKEKGILVTAFSPLAGPKRPWGSKNVIDSPILQEIAEKHGTTPGQVAIRWILDLGAGVTVKSSSPERMAQNLDVFGWSLSPEERKKISSVPKFRIWEGQELTQWKNSPYKSVEDLWDVND